MKSLSAALISALLVFTLATAWSELVQPQMDLIARANAVKGSKGDSKSSTRRANRQIARAETDEDEIDPDDEDAISETVPKATVKAARTTKKQREEAVAASKAKEQVVAQLAEVKQQETKLAAREETLRMLYDDIRSELANMEDLRRRSATELAASERRGVDGGRSNGDSGNEAIAATRTRVTSEARIASVIQDLARQGNVAAAASLLSGMKDREVAKVLTSLSASDPRLALRLSDQVQSAKQEPLRR